VRLGLLLKWCVSEAAGNDERGFGLLLVYKAVLQKQKSLPNGLWFEAVLRVPRSCACGAL
jgi:hypothetical protein